FYTASIIGGSILGLYNVIPQLQISVEIEELYTFRKYDASVLLSDERYSNTALFFGLGFRQNNITFGMRYDLLYSDFNSFYASAFVPFVRVYF
ncbi:MAG: alpha-ketoglutarate decarboxylase, partial [Flavobacteriales bacterium]